MNKKNRILALAAFVLCSVLSLAVFAAESKYAVSATGTNIITFAPSPGGYKITGLYWQCDTNPGPLVFYSRGTGAARYAPVVTPSNGQSVIRIANTAVAVSNGDIVVYVHANGKLDRTSVTSATATNCTLAAALTAVGASGDWLYEVTPVFQMNSGSAAISEFGGNIYAVPGEWPVSLQALAGTNSILGVTTDK